MSYGTVESISDHYYHCGIPIRRTTSETLKVKGAAVQLPRGILVAVSLVVKEAIYSSTGPKGCIYEDSILIRQITPFDALLTTTTRYTRTCFYT